MMKNIWPLAKNYLTFTSAAELSEGYYERVNVWSQDIYSQAVIWRNWSLLIALASLVICMLSLFVLFKLVPLKEKTPYLVFVDNTYGQPVSLKPVVNDELITHEALKKYMIRKFIIARERVNLATLDDDKAVAAALASESVYFDYRISLAQQSREQQRDVGPITIMFLNDKRAYASFSVHVRDESRVYEYPMNAELRFDFLEADLTLAEAEHINPVNFQVLTYQSHLQTELSP